MLKQGDRVKVEGVEADIETSWGQGKHTAYKLTDGRIVLDLNEKHLVPSLPFQVMVKIMSLI